MAIMVSYLLNEVISDDLNAGFTGPFGQMLMSPVYLPFFRGRVPRKKHLLRGKCARARGAGARSRAANAIAPEARGLFWH